MTRRVNLDEAPFDEPRDQPGFRCVRARIGRQLATERIGVSLWELPAGQAAYPYHLHLAEEEMLVVLRGAPSLRMPDGWRDLGPGELVSFPAGADGAHQIVNRTDETVRFLALSTHGDPDVVLYPDEGKLAAAERLPEGGGLLEVFRLADAVDYWDGVEPPPS